MEGHLLVTLGEDTQTPCTFIDQVSQDIELFELVKLFLENGHEMIIHW